MSGASRRAFEVVEAVPQGAERGLIGLAVDRDGAGRALDGSAVLGQRPPAGPRSSQIRPARSYLDSCRKVGAGQSGTGASHEFHAKRVPLSPTHLHQVLLFEIQGCSLAPHSHLVLDHFFTNAETKFERKIGARAQHQLCPGTRDVLYQAGDAKFAPAKSDPSRSKDWKARLLPAFLHQHSTEPSTANGSPLSAQPRARPI